MPRCTVRILLFFLALFLPGSFVDSPAWPSPELKLALKETRDSALDLEVAGNLASAPAGAIRFLTREELLRLPQVTATVTDDANFRRSVEISGVPLAELIETLSAKPPSDLLVAISADKYSATYTRAYMATHKPILVLKINGKGPEEWPMDPINQKLRMGPYLISHATFTPSFQVLSHSDEPQIPWGVVRLDFRDEAKVLGAIAPRGPRAQDADVQAGYRIAEQNCFRCHNMDGQGGQKAGRSWMVLATWATASREYFTAYIRNPKSENPKAEMPGFPGYDEATLSALTSYFRTFSPQTKP